LAAIAEELHGSLRGAGRIGAGGTEKIAGRFREHDFHDGFAVTGGGDGSGFVIGVTTTTDEGRIADPAGEFAAGAAGGGGGIQAAVLVESDGADGSLLVATMMFGGVGILAAAFPGSALRGGDKFVGSAEGHALLVSKAFGAGRNKHHVGTFFEHHARGLDGIFDAMESGDGTGAKRGGVHDDGVAFNVAVEIEMRAVAGIEDGIVFEDHDGGFDGVEGVATARENGPTGEERAKAAGFTGVDGVVGNVPGTTVDDKRRSHERRIAEEEK